MYYLLNVKALGMEVCCYLGVLINLFSLDFNGFCDRRIEVWKNMVKKERVSKAMFRIRKFLGLPDPLVRGTDPNPFIIKQK